MIPAGVEVCHAAPCTIELVGLVEAITTATQSQPVRPLMAALVRATPRRALRILAAHPDIIVGSVQAAT
jgi:hypothetical protein